MKISDIQVMYNKQDITDECKIEARDGNFVVETGKDLGDSDSIDIIYKVLFEKRIDGAIKIQRSYKVITQSQRRMKIQLL